MDGWMDAVAPAREDPRDDNDDGDDDDDDSDCTVVGWRMIEGHTQQRELAVWTTVQWANASV
jgi:hypothetical protein